MSSINQKLAGILDPSLDYLLGETEEVNLLKGLDLLPSGDKSHMIYTLDNLLPSVKTRLAYK